MRYKNCRKVNHLMETNLTISKKKSNEWMCFKSGNPTQKGIFW